MRACQISEQDLGFGRRASLGELERIHLEYLRVQAEERIQRRARFQDVTRDVTLAIELRRNLGLANPEIENRLLSQGEQSRLATERERQNCTPIDLRGPRLGPPRDQDSIGWCYAFSAADLLSYRLGERVSAADLAVQYNQQDFRSRSLSFMRSLTGSTLPPEGGWPSSAIQAAIRRGGACRERDFRSDDNGYNNLMDTMRILQRVHSGDPERCLTAARGTFPRIPTESISEVLNTSSSNLVNELAERACRPRLNLEGIQVGNMNFPLSRSESMIEKIDQILGQNQPIEASYTTGCIEAADCDGRGGLHSSLVVGRRFNASTGACEYLIRNSWGRSCRSQGRGMDCEQGNVWVPKHQLHRGLYGVTYLE
jgi:hypothetical protein